MAETVTIHVGETGIVFEGLVVDKTNNDAVVDISAATDMRLRLTNPSGTSVDKTASFTTDGSDGLTRYTISSSATFNTAGPWRRQWFVSGSGFDFIGPVISFQVRGNLPAPP